MGNELPEEAVAEALARLRVRGGQHARSRGGRGPWQDAADEGLSGGRDRREGHGTGEGWRGERGHRGGHGHRGAGGMHGGPALRRLIARLAASEHALSVSDVSIEIGVDQPRASRLVAQGVELGLLRREADPEDARRTRIALTDDGRAHAAHLREDHRRAVASALDGFSEVERAQFAELLTRFVDAWQADYRS